MADETPTDTTGEAETAPPCLSCGQPATWTSPTGHPFCDECRLLFQTVNPHGGLEPVDLHALMSGERPEQEWLVAPILPARKLIGIISKRGDGKSLLVLDMCIAKACGAASLLQPAAEPIHIVYIDMEMGPDDLYDRLQDMGYMPDNPLFDQLREHLHYYQLVALPPLDTEAGGLALEELVDRHGAQLVVIDTVSRVVTGEENSAEPYRELFRHTETRLKRRGITLVRLDHLGKEKERGSRGSSAKEDPLDVVWRLVETITDTGILDMTLTKGRQGWLPRQVTVHREEHGGIVRHRVNEGPTEDWLLDLIDRIDRLNLPADLGVNKTLEALRRSGQGTHRRKVSQAVRVRRARLGGSDSTGTTQNHLFGTSGGTGQNHQTETLTNTGNLPEPPAGTSQTQSEGWVLSPEGRTTPDQPPEDDYDPDFDLLDLIEEEDL